MRRRFVSAMATANHNHNHHHHNHNHNHSYVHVHHQNHHHHHRPRRRFAPLKEGATSDAPKLQGVVFDVDGTLCRPQNYMFGEMRAALGISKSEDILEHVYGLPTAEEQHAAMESIRNIERTAMTAQEPQPGLKQLMDYLASRGVRKGICTRNFDLPVRHLLAKYLAGHEFAPVVTRDFRPPKPDPAGILHIARSWGLISTSLSSSSSSDDDDGDGDGGEQVDIRIPAPVEEDGFQEKGGEPVKQETLPVATGSTVIADASSLIMVGDSIDDMTAGRRAGAATVLLVNEANSHLADHEHTDLVIARLDELVGILEHGFEGRQVVVVPAEAQGGEAVEVEVTK